MKPPSLSILLDQRLLLFSGLIAAALINLCIFGFPHTRSWGDAEEYNAYAVNLVTGHGYSMDGSTFSIQREPGYPAFLALLYEFFSIQSFTAVSFVQAILVGVLGYMVFVFFDWLRRPKCGVAAGVAIALFPY